LTFTFLIGLGTALTSPAWNAIIPELVERKELPAAVALNSAGYHVAQAVGPALGGFVVAVAGAAAAFLLNAASFLAVLGAIFRWRRTQVPSDAPPEAMLGATAAGLRYVRHAPAMQAVLVRNGLFILGASALWSLLPAMARHEFGLEATGYGIVLGSLGLGAVGGALLLPRLRRSLSIDHLTAGATVVFATASLALTYVRFVPLVLVSTMVGGLAWLVMLSTLGFASQTACPAWVRARALAIYLLVFQGVLAVGSIAWGAVAERFGSSTALAFAALALVCGLAAVVRWPLHVAEGLDLTPSGHWPDPEVALAPDAGDGPVLITVEYRVPAERASDFIETMDEMRSFRRREGAISWGIFRDAADPDHYVETFLVLTWGEHMRQHARVTVDDQALEARRNAFLEPGAAPFTSHLIDAHTFDGRTPAELPYTGLS
jgi:predicted MFS family arabinose efflux permease